MKLIEDIAAEFREKKLASSFDGPMCCDLSENFSSHASPLYEGSMLWCRNAIRNVALAKHRSRVVKPDFLSVRFVEDGSEYLRYEGKYILIEPGDVTILRSGCDYAFHTGADGFCVEYNITMEGTALNELLKKSHLSELFCFSISDKTIYLRSFEKLVRHLKSDQIPGRGANSALCLELLQNLADANRADSLPERLQEIVHFIERNLENKPAPESVSLSFGLCKSALNRLFRKHLRISTFQYITERKMELAALLLTEDALSVKETAVRLGFANQFSFSREFKKHFGFPPKKIRQMDRAQSV